MPACSSTYAHLKPTIAASAVLLIVVATVAGALALPTRQALSELPEGIGIEWLAVAPELPFRPKETGAFLQRHTYAPGAQLELPFVGPVLMYIESGTLTLDRVGNEVAVVYPAKIVEQPLTGNQLAKLQESEALPVGSHAEVGAGGSVYAMTGEVGPTRNAGDDALVLTVVLFVSEARPDDVTSVPVANPPQP